MKKLPIKKLSLRADLKIRARLYLAYLKKSTALRPLKAAAIAFALVALVSTPFAYQGLETHIYESSQIAKGDTFYQWKRTLENEKITISQSPEEKANLYLEFSDRRFQEALTLSKAQGYLSWLFPTAQAAKVDLSSDSAMELISESSFFISLSMSEANKIAEKLLRDQLYKKISTQIDKQDSTLKEKFATAPAPAEVKTVITNVSKINQINKAQIVEAPPSPTTSPAPTFVPLEIDDDYDIWDHDEWEFYDWDDEIEEDEWEDWLEEEVEELEEYIEELEEDGASEHMIDEAIEELEELEEEFYDDFDFDEEMDELIDEMDELLEELD